MVDWTAEAETFLTNFAPVTVDVQHYVESGQQSNKRKKRRIAKKNKDTDVDAHKSDQREGRYNLAPEGRDINTDTIFIFPDSQTMYDEKGTRPPSKIKETDPGDDVYRAVHSDKQGNGFIVVHTVLEDNNTL